MTILIAATVFLSIGAGTNNVRIAQYPVTNGEYAQFVAWYLH